MEPGYADNFSFDLGWQTEADATVSGGLWERAMPVATYYLSDISNPGTDLADDWGDWCYVTGNNPASAGADDVDGGQVRLSSPSMDLSRYSSPVMEFGYWFYNGGGSSLPNDSLFVEISNGLETVRLATYTMSANEWIKVRIENLEQYLELSDRVRVHFITGDDIERGHLVEAAIDGFALYDGLSTSTAGPGLNRGAWEVFPNPVGDYVTIRRPEIATVPAEFHLYNLQGQRLGSQTLGAGEQELRWFTGNLPPGIYQVQIWGGEKQEGSLRIIKP